MMTSLIAGGHISTIHQHNIFAQIIDTVLYYAQIYIRKNFLRRMIIRLGVGITPVTEKVTLAGPYRFINIIYRPHNFQCVHFTSTLLCILPCWQWVIVTQPSNHSNSTIYMQWDGQGETKCVILLHNVNPLSISKSGS